MMEQQRYGILKKVSLNTLFKHTQTTQSSADKVITLYPEVHRSRLTFGNAAFMIH